MPFGNYGDIKDIRLKTVHPYPKPLLSNHHQDWFVTHSWCSLINRDTKIKFSTTFFGLMAQLPYKSSKPEEANVWVEENAKNAIQEGMIFSEQFGSATYNLYGSPTMRFFEIDAFNSDK